MKKPPYVKDSTFGKMGSLQPFAAWCTEVFFADKDEAATAAMALVASVVR